ncbi:MAG TPA: hypothetical protein VIH99_01170 [Bdellovibrionota bacterium]
MVRFVFLILLFTGSPAARAREYDIYRADYFKGAFCAAIGGACAADDDMVSGFFQNPAALATGEERWDFDGDYASRSILEPGLIGNSGAAESYAAGGIGYSPGSWGAAIAFNWKHSDVDSPTTITDSAGANLNTRLYGDAYIMSLRLPMAVHLGNGVSIGMTISLNSQYQSLSLLDTAEVVKTSDHDESLRFSLGTLIPLSEKVRLGSWFRFPFSFEDDIQFSRSSTGAVTYREAFSLHSPWIWALGAAVSSVPHWFFYAENDLVGPTTGGYLFSYRTFSSSTAAAPPREKGRSVVFEPHLGARYSIDDRWTLHLGSYYENSRWESVRARVHGTTGISRKVGNFELIAGIDAARSYSQIFFTFR